MWFASQVESIRPSPSESVLLLFKAAIFFCIYIWFYFFFFKPRTVFEKVADHKNGRVVIVTRRRQIVLIAQTEDWIFAHSGKNPQTVSCAAGLFYYFVQKKYIIPTLVLS